MGALSVSLSPHRRPARFRQVRGHQELVGQPLRLCCHARSCVRRRRRPAGIVRQRCSSRRGSGFNGVHGAIVSQRLAEVSQHGGSGCGGSIVARVEGLSQASQLRAAAHAYAGDSCSAQLQYVRACGARHGATTAGAGIRREAKERRRQAGSQDSRQEAKERRRQARSEDGRPAGVLWPFSVGRGAPPARLCGSAQRCRAH